MPVRFRLGHLLKVRNTLCLRCTPEVLLEAPEGRRCTADKSNGPAFSPNPVTELALALNKERMRISGGRATIAVAVAWAAFMALARPIFA